MPKLYGNENFDFQVIKHLRNLGYDVLTSQEAGKSNQRIADDEMLEFAKSASRAILTFNRKNFFKVHKNFTDHYGIIACTYDANYEALAHRIHHAIYENDPIKGKLIRIYRPIP